MATIAILDDNVDSVRFLTRLLKFEGHVPVCLGSPAGAVEILCSLKPDLLLLDVMMPGITGIELLRLLRHEPSLTKMPVVMLSGVMDLDVQAEAFELGAVDFILKDMDWEKSLQRIGQHLPKN